MRRRLPLNPTNLFLAALAVVNTILLIQAYRLASDGEPPLLPLWTGTWTCADDPTVPCFQLDARATGRCLLSDPDGRPVATLSARLVGISEDRLVFLVESAEPSPPGQKQCTTSESYLLLRRSDGGATLARIVVNPPDFQAVYAPVAEPVRSDPELQALPPAADPPPPAPAASPRPKVPAPLQRGPETSTPPRLAYAHAPAPDPRPYPNP